MLEGIEYLYNKKPFENVNKNIHAWEYLNLSKFMTDIGSHEELNSLLSNFYFDSLDFYQEDILKVSAILFFEQIKLFFLYFKNINFAFHSFHTYISSINLYSKKRKNYKIKKFR